MRHPGPDYRRRAARLESMKPMVKRLRTLGIAIGLIFVIVSVWIVLIGPALLILLTPRS
jgi:hypothetical protein